MFNENSVGQRVISKANGVGIITCWDSDDTSYPVEVLFIEGEGYSDWYTKEGYISTDGENYDENIILLPTKQGSPDARRIVAMLAREWRASKTRVYPSKGIYLRNLYAHEYMYYAAKQLLSENNNERI